MVSLGGTLGGWVCHWDRTGVRQGPMWVTAAGNMWVPGAATPGWVGRNWASQAAGATEPLQIPENYMEPLTVAS